MIYATGNQLIDVLITIGVVFLVIWLVLYVIRRLP